MKNEYIRHILATIKYRLAKSLIHADEQFGNFSLGNGSRSPIEIISHMHDVLNWSISQSDDSNQASMLEASSSWDQAHVILNDRIDFYDALLSEKEIEPELAKILIQGPLADILTHIGQIAMLSRMNQKPIEGEDFSKAKI